MEHTGGDAARPFVEEAETTFPTVVDEHGVTSTLLGFKAVPNGVLVDEDGVIRWAKYGGFSIDKPEDVGVVEIDEDSGILGFQEKPDPKEAISTLANTGIYVLEPRAL